MNYNLPTAADMPAGRKSSESLVASTRIPSLDGLRAVAILFVLFAHCSITFPPGLVSVNFILPLLNGGLGVTIFFCISGFLITRLLIIEFEKTGEVSLKGFYIRRSFRILPAYWCFLLFVVVLNVAKIQEISVPNLLSGLFFVMNYSPANVRWILQHLWSLSVEEQFYLFCRWFSYSPGRNGHYA